MALPAVPWKSRWTEGPLPLWLVATAGGMAVMFVVGLFFYGSYVGLQKFKFFKAPNLRMGAFFTRTCSTGS